MFGKVNPRGDRPVALTANHSDLYACNGRSTLSFGWVLLSCGVGLPFPCQSYFSLYLFGALSRDRTIPLVRMPGSNGSVSCPRNAGIQATDSGCRSVTNGILAK